MIRVLIVYDIGDNVKRKRFADYLKSKGLSRIQRSVFIGRVTGSTFKDILRAIPRYLDPGRDIVHVFPITDYTLKYMRYYGKPFTNIIREEKALVMV